MLITRPRRGEIITLQAGTFFDDYKEETFVLSRSVTAVVASCLSNGFVKIIFLDDENIRRGVRVPLESGCISR